MRVGKGRCDKRLAQRKLSSNQRSENRHLAEWRFSPLIRIVTVYPKICSVIVIGISTTSSRRCDQPPAVRAAPSLSYQVLHILSRKALASVRGFSVAPGGSTRIVPLLLPSLYPPIFALRSPHKKTTLLFPKKHGKNVENPCILRHIGL